MIVEEVLQLVQFKLHALIARLEIRVLSMTGLI